MDPTTLVTFLFRAPAEARTVELLGSWDRFSQPYRMHNDRRRGIWSGIFKFENISFDGDDLRWTKPRTGGKLGLHVAQSTDANTWQAFDKAQHIGTIIESTHLMTPLTNGNQARSHVL